MSQFLCKNSPHLFSILILLVSFLGCEKRYDTVIDSTGNPPILTDAIFSLSTVNTDTINIGAERKLDDLLSIQGLASVRVTHTEGKKEIEAVRYSLIIPQSSTPEIEGILRDDGLPPDAFPNDNLYSGYINFQIKRVVVGNFFVKYWSKSNSGYQSNIVFLPLQIVRPNRPPIISDLIAPSTISLLQTSSFNIRVKVIDPDGQNDIKSVLRFTPSGKILQLQAQTLGDSIYVETVGLTPPPELGSYLFRFLAVDRSNDSSNVITKTIEITN